MKRISIHQPNFIPWMPYFEKMMAVDVFCIMRECQFEKGGYQNRFQYRDEWFTMSVNHGLELIKDKYYSNPQDDYARIRDKIEHPLLNELSMFCCERLVDFNSAAIAYIANKLGVRAKIVFDFPTEKKGTERLIEICQHYKCKSYLSGPSGKNYLKKEQFTEEGIQLLFHENKDRRHVLDVIR